MIRTWTILSLCLFAMGCYGVRAAKVPMEALRYPAPAPEPRGLIVFLPGMGNDPGEFARSGFVEIAHRVAPSFDVIAADAHFGYFRNFQVTERLHVDLIEPVWDDYAEIWVVGISIGGLVATTYAMEHPDRVDGVIALAPYLGGRDVITQIVEAGGLAQWVPPDLAQIDEFRKRHIIRLWSWFKGYGSDALERPALYFGVGEEDDLRVPVALVAESLAPGHFEHRPGGHAFRVWTPLFETLAGRAFGAPHPHSSSSSSSSRSGSAATAMSGGD